MTQMQIPVAKEPIMNPCKAIPFTNEGLDIINQLCEKLPVFLAFISDIDKQRALFLTLFGESIGEKVREKYNTTRDFGEWFLSLNYANQISILKHMGIYISDYPEIVNWEAIKAEQLEVNVSCEDWSQDDVRNFLSCDTNLWKYYPHNLIWLNTFLLFCNNNPINTTPFENCAAELETHALVQEINRYKNTKASCFGVLANWKNLWNIFLHSQARQQFVEFLKYYPA